MRSAGVGLVLALMVAASGGPITAVGAPVLVKDINPTGSSTPTALEYVGGALYFQADDGVAGSELWRSDGTAAGTSLVKEIQVGSQGSYPRSFSELSGAVYFSADDGLLGAELWRTDGTESGTGLVSDLYPGAGGSSPGVGASFVEVGGSVFFTAYGNGTGYELWKSDGTAAGTALVRDINPGVEGSTPLDLTRVAGTLFFRADDGLPAGNHRELWRSDGTESGTVMVRDINPSGGSEPSYLTDFGGTLFFSADDGVHGQELWRSDGSVAGTFMVTDINPAGGSSPGQLRVFDGMLYFTANDGTGSELWRSDGTSAGTQKVVDLNPAGGTPTGYLTVSGNYLYFVIPTGSLSAELWRTDGTAAGTIPLQEFAPTNYHPMVEKLTDVNGTLYFTANDGVHGVEVWRSDGTPEGTDLAADVNPGGPFSFSWPQSLTNGNGTLFFTADDGVHGYELWSIDGATTVATPAGDALATTALGRLASNPNPFRASTILHFDLGSPAPATVRIYDLAGRLVRDLVGGARLFSGPHEVTWDGRDDAGSEVAPGVYYYRVSAGGASRSYRLVRH